MKSDHVIPATTTVLLERLGAGCDELAWAGFDDRFRGVILSMALRLGLARADAEEVTQETMLQAYRDYKLGKYDRSRGRLSSWLIGIARNRIIDAMRRRKKEKRHSLRGMSEEDLSEQVIAQAFDHALERRIFERAWEWLLANSQSRDESLRAFELTAMRGVPVAEAAEQCGMSVDQVYVARSRVSARLRDVVERFDQAFRDGL